MKKRGAELFFTCFVRGKPVSARNCLLRWAIASWTRSSPPLTSNRGSRASLKNPSRCSIRAGHGIKLNSCAEQDREKVKARTQAQKPIGCFLAPKNFVFTVLPQLRYSLFLHALQKWTGRLLPEHLRRRSTKSRLESAFGSHPFASCRNKART